MHHRKRQLRCRNGLLHIAFSMRRAQKCCFELRRRQVDAAIEHGVKIRREAAPVARLGVAHVPEGRGTFAELTVWDNLRLGGFTRRDSLKDDFVRVLEYFPWLEERRSQQAGTLSGGEQQMLALARAFMQRPRLLLLDEPSLGLAPLLVTEVFRIVKELNDTTGLTVLVVEQNAHIALQVAQTACVLEVGRVALSGPSAELQEHESVRRSYLGY